MRYLKLPFFVSATFLFLTFLILAACSTPKATGSQQNVNQPASNLTEPDGLFTIHNSEGKLFYEIPDSLLGRDMIILSRIAKTAQGLGWGGDRLAPQQVVRWEKKNGRILLRGVSYDNSSSEDKPIYQAVENSNFPTIIEAFDIQKSKVGHSLIDVTDLYLGDSKAFGLQNRHRQQYRVTRLDSDRSYLEFAKTFPTNIEVRTVLTYEAAEPPSQERTGAISIEVNHSMILLPKEPMRPRLYDERVAMINVSQTDYGDDTQFSKMKEYVTRFRLEPKDPEAYKRGELVEPVKPIIFYIDPATPEKWRPYFKAGVDQWVEAFEAAGFKNAIRAEMAPEDDPDFSMLDARYSVIRYVANPVTSANAGPDVIDPRSGETIRAHMNMYHNVMKRMHWLSLSQTGPRNPEVQKLEVSTEEMGNYLQYVVSHEMAHALGYPHNQRANTAYSIEQLRSPEFTKEYGNSASVVGRTRYNYVAQPEDGDVRVHRSVGEYDVWAIKWAYTAFPDANSAEEEKKILDEWVLEQADNPARQFGYGRDDFDPTQITESIGDDWVRASELGMKNLHRVVPNLVDWIGVEGQNYEEVMMRYMQMYMQWGRLTERVIAAIGGSVEELKTYGQPGVVYTEITQEEQRRSMEFLDEHLFATPEWLIDTDLLRRFEHVGVVERIRWFQSAGLKALLSPHRLERLVEQYATIGEEAYGPAEMLDDLRNSVWSELDQNSEIDTYRRNLQNAWLDQVTFLLLEAEATAGNPPGDYRPEIYYKELRTDFHIQQSDIRALLFEQLHLLKKDVESVLENSSDRYNRAHLQYVNHRIDQVLADI
ncbi:MAG: zinc-dependent metalloprotease [Gracilimonas sp.]|uniref:zinc-dependent metalloprotease n=1 Tax=Gracilimonas sp. TaxID=1974203 RepID=UPI0037516CDE|nr:zinc-dependent metalloprotease [Gracilimonas sp.]